MGYGMNRQQANLKEAQVLRKKLVKLIGNENTANKELKRRLVGIVVLKKIVRGLRWYEQDRLKLHITLSIKMGVRDWLLVGKVLLRYGYSRQRGNS